MDSEPTDKKLFDEQMANNPRFKEAYSLLQQGLSNKGIANQMHVHRETVRKWFKKASLPARVFRPLIEADNKAVEAVEKRIEEGEHADDILEDYHGDVASELRRIASEKEDEALAEIADAQVTPADQYQSYIASASIKLLRDSIKNLKAPRTVRELSELDQLIRRNLGLNAKGGNSGQGKLVIDVSVLNNSLADKGKGAVSRMKSDVVDVEVIPKED